MIVIGYQGIGKTTLAKQNKRYVDLESSCFWFAGKREDNWFEVYCNIAEHLSKQGYVVLVSPHNEVRNRLKTSNEMVAAFIPNLKLKDKWIEKLKKRWDVDKSDKNYKAYMSAACDYEKHIIDIFTDGFYTVILNNFDYDLQREVEDIINYERVF